MFVFAWLTSLFAGSFFSSLATLLKPLIEIGTIVLKTLIDFISWYAKEFWNGLGVIFHNLSTLTVILVVFIIGGYYFKTWDNDKVLQQCVNTCPTVKVSEKDLKKKYSHPIKRIYKEPVRPQSQQKITKRPEGVSRDVFSGN